MFNPQARLGYYDQELRRIDLNSTPLEFGDIAPNSRNFTLCISKGRISLRKAP